MLPGREGNGNPLQYSGLENPMDRGAWQATVYGVAKVGHDLVTKSERAQCTAPRTVFFAVEARPQVAVTGEPSKC